MSFDGPPVQFGNRHDLNLQNREKLENEILPAARRWVEKFPALRGHGIQTLEYWGETIPRYSGDNK